MPADNSELAWTGERLMPEVGGDLVLEHLHRYAAALEVVRGKRVLDIACGEGYGTHLLATRAARVIGVDIAPAAAAHARAKYGHAYLAGSCDAIPLGRETVDVVVSFETLEHIHTQEEFLAEVRRVLVPGGIFLVCTPDKKVYSDDRDYQNEFHVRELYHEEFGEFVRGAFRNVRLYRQRVVFGSLLVPDPPTEGTPFGRYQADLEKASFEEGLPDGMYTTALCSDGTLPCLPGGILVEEGHTDAQGRLEQTREVLEQERAAGRRLRRQRKQAQTVAGLLFLALLLALLLGCSQENAEPPTSDVELQHPARATGVRRARRVILITCDTLRADHVGGALGLTPALDDLARQATVYPRAFSTAPTTGPSFAGIFTGFLPSEVGVLKGNRYQLASEIDTFTEQLAYRGIPTAAVVSNFVLHRQTVEGELVGISQGFDLYDDELPDTELNRKIPERNAVDTTSAALRILRSFERDGIEEFFLWVHYMDPHGPYTPPAEFAARDAGTLDPGPCLPIGTSHSGKGQIPRYQDLDGECRAGTYRELYRSEIRSMDDALGELLAYLGSNGRADEALILFAADHGEALGEHDYWFCHGETTYPCMVHVPLIARFPGQVQPAKDERLVSLLDLHATVLDAFGLAPTEGFGASLFAPPRRSFAIQELVSTMNGSRWWGITDGRFQLVVEGDRKPQLFDLQGDLSKDVAEKYPGRLAELTAARRPSRDDLPKAWLPKKKSASKRAKMDALGYTGNSE